MLLKTFANLGVTPNLKQHNNSCDVKSETA